MIVTTVIIPNSFRDHVMDIFTNHQWFRFHPALQYWTSASLLDDPVGHQLLGRGRWGRRGRWAKWTGGTIYLGQIIEVIWGNSHFEKISISLYLYLCCTHMHIVYNFCARLCWNNMPTYTCAVHIHFSIYPGIRDAWISQLSIAMCWCGAKPFM